MLYLSAAPKRAMFLRDWGIIYAAWGMEKRAMEYIECLNREFLTSHAKRYTTKILTEIKQTRGLYGNSETF